MEDVEPTGARARGLLPGFANSADLGGLALPHGKRVPSRRIIRANTPEHLTNSELADVTLFMFGAVFDLRSCEELQSCPHPLAGLPGYRSLPLIDPVAEAREDFSRYRTLGEIYSSSLERNARHIARIFGALAGVPQSAGPVLVSCYAGRDRTGMVIALLLDLAGVDRKVIAADYALLPEPPTRAGRATPDQLRQRGSDILHMLEHVSAECGSTAGYLRWLGLDDGSIHALRRRIEP